MSASVRIIVLILILCHQSSGSSRSVNDEAAPPLRLPTAFEPEHYKLEISTHLDDAVEAHPFTFTGRVWIKILCKEATANIVLHSRQLHITPSQVTLVQLESPYRRRPIELRRIVVDEQNEFLVISAAQNLTAGNRYELHIPFAGDLDEDPVGYYRSSYTDRRTNSTLWMTVTQFEALDARAAFPCFDEPALKAKFEVILCHRGAYNALSNMPVQKSIVDPTQDDWVCDHFKRSVTMSTFLVAFSINKFEHRDSDPHSNGGLQFRVWSRPDYIDETAYALWLAPRVLRYYETFFALPYPMPKLDLIAVPVLNAAGMENYGLITFAEEYLLYSLNTSSLIGQQRAASLIAHEVAHMWFGNLVTLTWWSDVWLNEAMPTYLSNLCVQHIHPEWDFRQIEDFHNILVSLRLDAESTSRPILGDAQVATENDISEMFQGSAYEKGATMARMLHHVLGDVAFRNGLRRYLRTFQYGNVVVDDFVQSMQKESGTAVEEMPLKTIIDTWLRQPGFPVIYVQRNYGNKSVLITQQRYVDSREVGVMSATEQGNVSQSWWVPLKTVSRSVASAPDHQSSVVLRGRRTNKLNWLHCDSANGCAQTIYADTVNGSEWLLYNVGMAGLFRVRYDARNWEMLIDQLAGPHFRRISAVNRAQLIDDAMGEAWTGHLNYDLALRLVAYLSQEEEYIPWAMALDNLDTLNEELDGTSLHHLFQGFVRNLLTPIYEKVGGLHWDAKSHLINTHLKTIITKYGCLFNVSDCRQRAFAYFRDLMNAPQAADNKIPADLRATVYCTVIRAAGQTEWDFLFKRYYSAPTVHEREEINTALGCVGEQKRGFGEPNFGRTLVMASLRYRFRVPRPRTVHGRTNSGTTGPAIVAEPEIDESHQGYTQKSVQTKKYGLGIRNKFVAKPDIHRRIKRNAKWLDRSRRDIERFLRGFR